MQLATLASCFVLVSLTITSIFLWAHQAVEIIEEEIGGEGMITVAPAEPPKEGTAPEPTVPPSPEIPPSLPLGRKVPVALVPHPAPDSGVHPVRKGGDPKRPISVAVSAPAEPETPAASAFLPRIGLAVPRCEGIYVYIVSAFDDPAHSVATLATNPKKPGKRVWVGQMFGEYRVLKIDYNQRYFSSAVWLEVDSAVCQVLLRDDHPIREGFSAKAARRKASASKKARAKAKKKQKTQARKSRLRRSKKTRRHR